MLVCSKILLILAVILEEFFILNEESLKWFNIEPLGLSPIIYILTRFLVGINLFLFGLVINKKNNHIILYATWFDTMIHALKTKINVKAVTTVLGTAATYKAGVKLDNTIQQAKSDKDHTPLEKCIRFVIREPKSRNSEDTRLYNQIKPQFDKYSIVDPPILDEAGYLDNVKMIQVTATLMDPQLLLSMQESGKFTNTLQKIPESKKVHLTCLDIEYPKNSEFNKKLIELEKNNLLTREPLEHRKLLLNEDLLIGERGESFFEL